LIKLNDEPFIFQKKIIQNITFEDFGLFLSDIKNKKIISFCEIFTLNVKCNNTKNNNNLEIIKNIKNISILKENHNVILTRFNMYEKNKSITKYFQYDKIKISSHNLNYLFEIE